MERLYIFNITNKSNSRSQTSIKNIINKFKIRERDLIIDIGSNDGTFLNFFKKKL